MVVLLLVLSPVAVSAADTDEAPAQLEIAGLGWWDNRGKRTTLDRLLGDDRGPVLNANAVEDAVFLLMSALEDDGYLRPHITAVLTRADGTVTRHDFDVSLTTLLPRPMAISIARFEIEQGVRYRVEDVEISGLTALPLDEVRRIFRPTRGLLPGITERLYSPGRLRRAIDILEEELSLLGHAEAVVTVGRLDLDHETGSVDLGIEISEGPLWRVGTVNPAGAAVDLPDVDAQVGEPWTFPLQQNLAQSVRQAHYIGGYPDVRVQVSGEPAAGQRGERSVAVEAGITAGQQVHVGDIRYEGNEHTRPQVLDRRVEVQSGDLLNPLELERIRYRLGQLGIFDSVDLRYEPALGEIRNPVFVMVESPRWEASLLAGYGSYEQLRGGVELRQINLFGRAHQSRLLLVQSMKSTRGDYTYSVPEIFGEQIDGSASLFGLHRQERAFLRKEYGGSVSLRRPIRPLRADASAGFTYQALRSEDNELETREIDERQVTVASVDLGLTRDTRDNPLRPRRGYRWFVHLEHASKAFGGEVDYQLLELGLTLHKSIGRNQWIHAGLTHGVIATLGSPSDRDLPVNKRFYPGGDASIRGYKSGEASPLGADGRFLGAKTYLLLNVDWEQSIRGNWSAVVFFDALGMAARLSDYPFAEQLYSLGVGVRYQTIIGPLRLEYGRNLNPRPHDPGGALHFSVGFPF